VQVAYGKYGSKDLFDHCDGLGVLGQDDGRLNVVALGVIGYRIRHLIANVGVIDGLGVPVPPMRISPPASLAFWIYPVIFSNAGRPLWERGEHGPGNE
jgi:hypothetical protein